MIKFGTFAIDADEYGYQVGDLKVRTVKDKDENEIQQEFISKPIYCSSLQGAITSLLKREQRRAISSSSMTLEQAIDALNSLQSRFEDYLSAVREEVKGD